MFDHVSKFCFERLNNFFSPEQKKQKENIIESKTKNLRNK